MTKDSYLQDLTEIRSMMERSTRFLSLSGLSGVLAGSYALIGAFLAHRIIYTAPVIIYNDITKQIVSPHLLQLLILALGVMILAIGSGILLSKRKAQKAGETFWNKSAKRMLMSLFIPLFTGGLFSVALYFKGYIPLIAPATLIFYGLALVNARKYTYVDIGYLGITEIILGLVSCFFTGYGLYFWAFGFGVLHIVYGISMYLKYER